MSESIGANDGAPGGAAPAVFALSRARGGRLARMSIAFIFLIPAAACSFPDEDERALGAAEAAQADSTLPIVHDTAIDRFVTTLGRSLTSTTSRADLDWHFEFVNVSAVNAVSLPGGYVYVTRGLLETVDRYDELAGVMGHEIGHVVRRHSVKQLEKNEKRDAGLVLLCMLTRACSLGRIIALQIGADAMEAHYSQKDESEADSEAVVITLAAGIDPEGVPGFFEKMLKLQTGQPTPIDAFFSTHPTDEARISAVRRQIAGLGPLTGRTLVRDTPDFHALQARVRALPPPPPLQQP